MTSITKLKTAQSIQFFDPSVALSLVQAFHRHLDLDALLALVFSQAEAILKTAGLQYRNPGEGIDLSLGRQGRHTASYNLTYQDRGLGELIFHFDRRINEDTLATAEDLVALAMSPIDNALRHGRAAAAHRGLEPATSAAMTTASSCCASTGSRRSSAGTGKPGRRRW